MNFNVLISVNIATLITIIIYGYKIIRYLDRIEFKTDMMWKDYENRMLSQARKSNAI